MTENRTSSKKHSWADYFNPLLGSQKKRKRIDSRPLLSAQADADMSESTRRHITIVSSTSGMRPDSIDFDQPTKTEPELQVDDRVRFTYKSSEILEGVIVKVEPSRIQVQTETSKNPFWIEKTQIELTIPRLLTSTLEKAWWLRSQNEVDQAFRSDGFRQPPKKSRGKSFHIGASSMSTALTDSYHVPTRNSDRISRANRASSISMHLQEELPMYTTKERRVYRKPMLSQYEKKLWSTKLTISYKKTLKRKLSRKAQGRYGGVNYATNFTDNVRFWQKTVLPHWDDLKQSVIVKYFWERHGIPSGLRGDVWLKAIGNGAELKMNSFKHFYELASKRARRTAIDDDITRIDPDMSPELHEQVYSILAAFCEYDPSVGYVQNMTFIAILLLEYMTPPQAFHAFVNMLHTDFMAAYVSMNVQEIRLRIKNFLCLLSINLPDVSSHFNHLFLPVDTFLMDYVSTLFSKQLNKELVSRIWDNYFLWGEIYIYQAAVGVISILTKKYRLFEMDITQCLQILTNLPQDLCPVEDLVAEIEQVKMNKSILRFFWTKQNHLFDLEDMEDKVVTDLAGADTMSSFTMGSFATFPRSKQTI